MGGALALEFAFDRPSGLRSLVLANTWASTPLWRQEAARLISEMPVDVQETLRKHEEAGTTEDPEYGEATMEFYDHIGMASWMSICPGLQRITTWMNFDSSVSRRVQSTSRVGDDAGLLEPREHVRVALGPIPLRMDSIVLEIHEQ